MRRSGVVASLCVLAMFAFYLPSTLAAVASWTNVNQPDKSYYPNTLEHASAVYFKNHFWMIGCKAYILRSSDCKTWERAVTTAPFGTRYGHRLLVFNDKLWLIGGAGSNKYADYQLKNDVWSSSDGVNWTRVVEHAPWSPRLDHAVIVFNGKMWIFGGSQASGQNVSLDTTSMNDIWYSSNGSSWTRAVSAAEWSQRSGHQVVFYNDHLWLVGGSNLNDVWRSDDGKKWELRAANCSWLGRRGFALTVLDGKMWIIGGGQYAFNSSGQSSICYSYSLIGDMWSSSNGIDWQKGTTNSGSARYNFPWCMEGSTFWAFPGPGKGSYYNTETCKTTNATSWTKLKWDFKMPLSTRNVPFVHNSKIWLFSQAIPDGGFPQAAWSSADGYQWALRAQDATIIDSWYHGQPFSMNGSIWEIRNNSQLYHSPDGKQWSVVATQLPNVGDIVPHQNQMWLISHEHLNYQYFNRTWISTDYGQTWVAKMNPTPLQLSYINVSFNGRVWSINDKVRSSSNAIDWRTDVDAAPWGADPRAAAVSNSRLWVVSASTEIWSSADGKTWIKNYGVAPWAASLNTSAPVHIIAYSGALWYLSSMPDRYTSRVDTTYKGEAWRFDTQVGPIDITKSGVRNKTWSSFR